jgi:hypothetical protein
MEGNGIDEEVSILTTGEMRSMVFCIYVERLFYEQPRRRWK